MSDVVAVTQISATSHKSRARSFLSALRPKQWVKNSLVGAAPLAAGELLHTGVLVRVAVLFIALSCASSAGYLVNDIRDRDYDRAHPLKQHRPLASGAVSVSAALVTAGVLGIVAVCLAALCSHTAAWLTTVYLMLTLSYSLWLKRVPGVEMVVVSAGFLLRAVIGGVGTGTALSEWFLSVICAAALLVVSGKRLAEMQRLSVTTSEFAEAKRGVLTAYSVRYLRTVVTMAAGIAIASYAAWVLFVGMRRGSAWLTAASVAPLSAALARYVHVANSGGGESPEDALLDDMVMLILGAAWLVLFTLSLANTH